MRIRRTLLRGLLARMMSVWGFSDTGAGGFEGKEGIPPLASNLVWRISAFLLVHMWHPYEERESVARLMAWHEVALILRLLN